ncbi:TPA: DUF1351 domain-containing protein [Streptococcus pyogenes]|nr:DUF1351 domain-containing protein [Streptococcus pyogenes]
MKDVTNNFLETIRPAYTPGKIDFDFESFDKAIASAVAELDDEKLELLDYNEIKAQITRYKTLDDNLEAERKAIAKVYKNPLTDFENGIKKSRQPITKLLTKLRGKRDEVDNHVKSLRLDTVRAVFEEKCMVAGLEKTTFETRYTDFSKSDNFKQGKMELKKATLDEMDALVLAEFDKLEQYKANIQAVKDQAQEYDLLADSYVRDLENGKSLVDVLKTMKSDRDAAILRKEQQEAQARAEAERKAEIERLAQEQANANIKAIDAETGEILEDEPIMPEPEETTLETPKFEPIEPVSYDLRLTFPGGNQQAKLFKEWLLANQVNFETLYQGKTQSELLGGISNVFD